MCGARRPAPRRSTISASGPSAAELLGVDLVGAQLPELLARQGHARSLGDPPPVGVAAVERGLDERRVGDRPRDPLGLLGSTPRPRTSIRPTRVAPSPSATTSSANWSRTASRSPSGSGRPEDPVAWSRTVSLVLIWPSTVIRSNEPPDGRPQAAVGIGQTGRPSGRSRAWSRSRGWIIPAPFAWAVTVTPSQRTRAALRAAVRGHDRPSELLGPARRQAPRRLARSPRRTASMASGTPITPVSATIAARGSSPSASAAASRIASASR